MTMNGEAETGGVISIWRYPVKSMIGEELAAARVGPGGLEGDRTHALIDQADGRVASAKNPRKWPALFSFSARLDGSTVRITLPDGSTIGGDEPSIHRTLSEALGRDVVLAGIEQERIGRAEGYWPDLDGLPHRDAVAEFMLQEGTFFDCAPVHLISTATLRRLGAAHPGGRFDFRRFRPNLVIEAVAGAEDFVEDAWVGRTLAVGAEARLEVWKPCGRCVMTTLPQGDLPKDTGILRAIVEANQGHAGVYARMARPGTVRCGDQVRLL